MRIWKMQSGMLKVVVKGKEASAAVEAKGVS
jgi:hypothetical protein